MLMVPIATLWADVQPIEGTTRVYSINCGDDDYVDVVYSGIQDQSANMENRVAEGVGNNTGDIYQYSFQEFVRDQATAIHVTRTTLLTSNSVTFKRTFIATQAKGEIRQLRNPGFCHVN
jgi:hypothetical protein